MSENALPSKVQEKIDDINRSLDALEEVKVHLVDSLTKNDAEIERYSLIRQAILETAHLCLGSSSPLPVSTWEGSDRVTITGTHNGLDEEYQKVGHPGVATTDENGRKRRDIRGEVLACLSKNNSPMSVDMIVKALDTLPSSVEKALEYHARHGRIYQDATTKHWALMNAVADPAQASASEAVEAVKETAWESVAEAAYPYPPSAESPIPRWMKAADMTVLSETVGPEQHQSFLPEPPVMTDDRDRADQLLDFIRRAGDMGIGDSQLDIINASPVLLNQLVDSGQVEEGDDGRYRARVIIG